MAAVSELVERDAELLALRGALHDAGGGEGSVVFVEALAGQGKTALLRALRQEASAAGLRVLHAAGAEIERDFPFGIVRQLFENELLRSSEERRERLLAGAARLAVPAFETRDVGLDASDASLGRLHGLYWLAANLADEQPLALVIDDAHWADVPSMRFLDVLGRRLDDIPVLLGVGARPTEPGAEQDLLDSLRGAPAARVLRPGALSAAGVGRLIDRTLGAPADEAFVTAATETTAGSPLLVRELLRTIAEARLAGRAEEIQALRQALPSNVGRIVVARLRRLSPDALAVARAVAVLGDRAGLVDVAALAELDLGTAAAAHATLARAGLLEADSLRFSYPVVRDAVHDDLVSAERGQWHRRAAFVRMRAGAGAEEISAHLLSTEAVAEPWAAAALVTAGRRALADGAAAVAVRHLRRAAAEPLDPRERDHLLLSLGHAAARTGDPDAVSLLEQASDSSEPGVVAQAARLLAQVLVIHDRPGDGIEVLQRALDAVAADEEVAAEIENDLVDVLAHHLPARGEYLRRLETVRATEQPTVLSHLAFVRLVSGAPASEVLELARRALAARGAGGERFVHFYAVESLMALEAADEAAAALRTAAEIAQRAGSRTVAGPLTYMPSASATWERAFGDLRQAEEQARYSLDLVTATAPGLVDGLRTSLMSVLVDRGRYADAEAELARLPPLETGPGLTESHAVRARLRHAQGRHEEALAELEAELERERDRGWATGNREPSRLTQVRVLLALGRTEEAHEAACGELAVAERREIAGPTARAQLGRALTLQGRDAIDHLVEAAETARSSPSRRLQAEILVELGSALRRAGERAACREPLGRARDLAHQCGASRLEEHALEELMIAGARPRRVALSGVDSLTAAERRVADLAAQGMRNRDIAATLFVTPKTVEVQLGRVYSKLEIRGRPQLPEALSAEG